MENGNSTIEMNFFERRLCMPAIINIVLRGNVVCKGSHLLVFADEVSMTYHREHFTYDLSGIQVFGASSTFLGWIRFTLLKAFGLELIQFTTKGDSRNGQISRYVRVMGKLPKRRGLSPLMPDMRSDVPTMVFLLGSFENEDNRHIPQSLVHIRLDCWS